MNLNGKRLESVKNSVEKQYANVESRKAHHFHQRRMSIDAVEAGGKYTKKGPQDIRRTLKGMAPRDMKTSG